jgi:hypothetical protein
MMMMMMMRVVVVPAARAGAPNRASEGRKETLGEGMGRPVGMGIS